MSDSIYSMVTDRIVAQLEKGIVPWQKPWTGVIEGAYNRMTRRPYSLLNQLMLNEKGEYASYKQWKDLGGQVRKGAKAEIVVFWKVYPVKKTMENGAEKTEMIPVLKYYNVFHVSQVDGVEPLKKEKLVSHNPIDEAEKIVSAYQDREMLCIRRETSNNAYYSPMGDYIVVPKMEQFVKIEQFYSTLFHEMIHSTGHKSRLNRLETSKTHFGSESYSKEELVAEIGSATMMNKLGIETQRSFKNSTAYIQSWLQALKNDTRLIVSAAGKAEKAVEYIYNGKIKEDKYE